MNKETNTSFLNMRSDINKKYASNDFESWTQSILNDIEFKSVLDLCCGTGNQLVLYSKMSWVYKMYGVDISEDALKVAKSRIEKKESCFLHLKQVNIDNLSEMFDTRFDLISCFYGLYYSSDVTKTLREMITLLNSGGTILIVGGYGANNKSIFDVVQKYYQIPEQIIRSSNTFMEADVLPYLMQFGQITINIFKNEIRFNSVDSFMDYFRATTYYNESYDNEIKEYINNIIIKDGYFNIEKHVMAIIMKRGL